MPAPVEGCSRAGQVSLVQERMEHGDPLLLVRSMHQVFVWWRERLSLYSKLGNFRVDWVYVWLVESMIAEQEKSKCAG